MRALELATLLRHVEDLEAELGGRGEVVERLDPVCLDAGAEPFRLRGRRQRMDDRHTVAGLREAEVEELVDDVGRLGGRPDPPGRPLLDGYPLTHVGEQLLDTAVGDVRCADRRERRPFDDADAAVVEARDEAVVGNLDEPVRALGERTQLGRQRHAPSLRRGLPGTRRARRRTRRRRRARRRALRALP